MGANPKPGNIPSLTDWYNVLLANVAMLVELNDQADRRRHLLQTADPVFLHRMRQTRRENRQVLRLRTQIVRGERPFAPSVW